MGGKGAASPAPYLRRLHSKGEAPTPKPKLAFILEGAMQIDPVTPRKKQLRCGRGCVDLTNIYSHAM